MLEDLLVEAAGLHDSTVGVAVVDSWSRQAVKSLPASFLRGPS